MSNRQSAILYCICLLFVSSVLSGCISGENNGTVVPTTTAMPTTTPVPTEPPYTVRLVDAWTLNIGGEPEFPPVLVQGSICVVTEERILLVSGEGDVLWDEPLSGKTRMLPIVDGDLLYLVYKDGRVERRDGATGEVAWVRSVDAYSGFAPVCAYRDNLYVSTTDGYLLCLRAGTGDAVWRIELPVGSAFSSIVPCGDLLLLDEFYHDKLTVVDADTGAVLNVWEGKHDLFGIVAHGDAVYSPGGFCFTRYDAHTGTMDWDYDYVEYGGTWIQIFADFPYAFVSTVRDQLLCFDMESGDLLWSDEAMYRAGLAVSGNVLVAGIAEIPDLHKVDTETPERELVAWDLRGQAWRAIPWSTSNSN